MEKSYLDSELLAMKARYNAGQTNAAPIELEKLGPQMRAAGVEDAADVPPQDSPNVTIKLIVAPDKAAETTNWINARGGEVISAGTSVFVANLDVSRLSDLDELPGLQRAEASRRLQLKMEDARGPITGADAGMAAHDVAGEGVVVGIIDTGIDWSHADFINDDGTSRLELFIKAERPENASTSTYQEFDGAQINAALAGGGGVPMGDPNGHGTHCSAIAAGNGRASGGTYQGLASGATIMAMSSSLYDDEIITGIRRIFEIAGDRPVVINLSLGGHWGAHDGTSAIENVIAEVTGPGRIICVAAGNEGEDHIHWDGQLVQSAETVMIAKTGDPQYQSEPAFQFVDVWIPRGDDVDVILKTSKNEIVPIDGLYHTTSIGNIGGMSRIDSINGEQNITLFLDNCIIGETVSLRLTANTVVHGEVHAWSGGKYARNVFPNTSAGNSIGMPATEEQAISVASFVSRASTFPGDPPSPSLTVGGLSPFSSRGPTRIGTQKPDTSGPGQFIIAALAADSRMATDPRYAALRDDTGTHISIQGTSMATPFVAGAVALLLQREPNLNPAEIKQRLRATADRDATTGRVWNREFGCGRINVQALLDY